MRRSVVFSEQYSTSFTAALSLSNTQRDWQFMKASAVMKSYSEAEKMRKLVFLISSVILLSLSFTSDLS